MMLSFEETYENLDYLNKRMLSKLKEQGMTQDFEIAEAPVRKISLSPTSKVSSTLQEVKAKKEKAYELTRSKVSDLLRECHASRLLLRKDLASMSTLKEVSRHSEVMKEAIVRYEDGKPFFRDLKVMEIVEDMQILDGIDKEIFGSRIQLPPINASSLKKNRFRGSSKL